MKTFRKVSTSFDTFLTLQRSWPFVFQKETTYHHRILRFSALHLLEYRATRKLFYKVLSQFFNNSPTSVFRRFLVFCGVFQWNLMVLGTTNICWETRSMKPGGIGRGIPRKKNPKKRAVSMCLFETLSAQKSKYATKKHDESHWNAGVSWSRDWGKLILYVRIECCPSRVWKSRRIVKRIRDSSNGIRGSCNGIRGRNLTDLLITSRQQHKQPL